VSPARVAAYVALCSAAHRATAARHADPVAEAELLAARTAHTVACGVPADYVDPATGLDTRED
jgi:hypothetical protein